MRLAREMNDSQNVITQIHPAFCFTCSCQLTGIWSGSCIFSSYPPLLVFLFRLRDGFAEPSSNLFEQCGLSGLWFSSWQKRVYLPPIMKGSSSNRLAQGPFLIIWGPFTVYKHCHCYSLLGGPFPPLWGNIYLPLLPDGLELLALCCRHRIHSTAVLILQV